MADVAAAGTAPWLRSVTGDRGRADWEGGATMTVRLSVRWSRCSPWTGLGGLFTFPAAAAVAVAEVALGVCEDIPG